MASIMQMPTELALMIVNNLDRVADLAAIALTSRKYYAIADPILYRAAVQQNNLQPLFHSASHGLPNARRKALSTGADPKAVGQKAWTRKEWRRLFLGHNPEDEDACRPLPTSIATYLMGTEQARSVFYFSTYHHHMAARPTSDWYDEEHFEDDEGWAMDQGEAIRQSTTPLHVAAQYGCTETIEILLNHGADIDGPSMWCCGCHASSSPSATFEMVNSSPNYLHPSGEIAPKP